MIVANGVQHGFGPTIDDVPKAQPFSENYHWRGGLLPPGLTWSLGLLGCSTIQGHPK